MDSFSDILKQEMESIEKDQPATPANNQDQSAQEMDEILQYKGLIQQTVQRYWRRPPGARNDMTVVLDIQLLPGGELKSVRIEDSSGNQAFDNSAMLAVQSAGRFSVPPDPKLFDRHFRAFKMRFKPGDLRY
ncbi:cell envelope integrity protein TolA [Ketobacter sp. MCCC 1A13808]|nr:cell envelope integrity protein TolA [Ketobacter sp. MCCC 1A13808]RLP56162.1 MAG: cell envelope integrity protein TolA [Ketobacter sp.]